MSEIIEPSVNETEETVYFSVVRSHNHNPPTLEPSIDLVAIPRGKPKGYYAVGTLNDTAHVVLNTVDPLNPTVLKVVQAPTDYPGSESYRTYDFDDQYLYLFSNLTGDNFGRECVLKLVEN